MAAARDVENSEPLAAERITSPRFDVSIDSGTLSGIPYPSGTTNPFLPTTFRVPRKVAMRVGAVKAARDQIAGMLGSLPLRMYDAQGNEIAPPLLTQPEPDIAASVTWTKVAEDLLFDGQAWLLVLSTGYTGRPTSVRRLQPESITVFPRIETTAYGMYEAWPETPGLIRIDSPNPPLLVTAAEAIGTALALGRATNDATGALPPLSFFTSSSDVDPFDSDDDVSAFLTEWESARRSHRTGYAPAGLELSTVGWNPEELTLDALRDQSVKEIARHAGISPDRLGVPVTTHTYKNVQDDRRDFINQTLNPFMQAIEDRFTMNDLTPGGYSVRFDLSDFLRADDGARMAIAVQGLKGGVLRDDEARSYYGGLIGPGPAPTPPAPAPAAAPDQEVTTP